MNSNDFTTAIPGTPIQLDQKFRKLLRPAASSLPESGIIELVNYGREKPDLIPLWVGEGDKPTPDFISNAATSGLLAGQTFYTWQRGIPPLRESLARYYQRHFNVDTGTARIIVTASGMQGMMESLQAIVGAGDEVVVISPVWPNIYACVHMQQATARSVALTLDTNSGWQLDMEQLFAACNSKTRAIYVNSPGNPTGWKMPLQQMQQLRDYCRERGIWILSDEVYGKFTFDTEQEASSFLQICDPQDALIVCNSFSKNWAMTGWRVGWLVIPAALGQVFENLVQYNTSGVPEFLQRGCIAALDHGDEFLQQQIDNAAAGRALATTELAKCENVQFSYPQGSFYLFFKVTGHSDSVVLAKKLVDLANVGVAPGTAFGPGGEGYLRICFVASRETLAKGMDRLLDTLAKI